jgi:hypothetical protein
MVEELIFRSLKEDVFNVDSYIDVFVTRVMNEQTLATNWKDIRNHIARRQFELEDEFERWNFYLFYVVDSPMVDLNLKYEIEHDTVSSRKMVVDASEVDDELCYELVKKFIKYDIENKEQQFTKVFTKNEMVSRWVNRIKEDLG